MQTRSAIKRLGPLVFILLLHFILSSTSALKCRSDEGFSDADLKRVARNCMQKIGENSYSSGQHSNWSSGSGFISPNIHYYGQRTPYQQQQKQQYDPWNYGGQNSRGKIYFTGYDEQNDSDDDDDEHFYRDVRERNNSNNNNYPDHSEDILRQRNREHMQNQQHSERSSNNGHNSKGNSNGGGGSQRTSSSSGSSSNGNNNNRNNKNNNHSNNNNNNNNNNNSNNNTNNNNGNSLDAACIVHCFFDEMNMLNQQDFPDRYKVNYLLTKDLHDRELRSFYAETIQECFRYLESQRRRSDKCQFSRDLISCMTEYAKANCDDWENYNVMFN